MTASDEPLSRFDPRGTYDAAARDYEDAGDQFWRFASEQTIERLELRSGAVVLDAACGTGWSALPAAARVGPSGRVVAIDFAEQMLAVARAKANRRGLGNIEFRLADMTELEFPDGQFDAVICVLGIFFVDDMPEQVRKFWRVLRPGGTLGITTLGPQVFTPLIDAYREAVRRERPDLEITLPWERTNEPDIVRRILSEAGVDRAEITLEIEHLPLPSPDDWWRLVMGTGLRRYVMELGPEAADPVRIHNTAWARENDVTSVDLSVIYAVATKGG